MRVRMAKEQIITQLPLFNQTSKLRWCNVLLYCMQDVFSNSPLKCCLWPQRHYCITIVVVFAFMKTVGSRVLGLGSNYSLHIYPNRNLPSALRHMKVTLYHVLPRKLKNIFQMQENNLSSYSSVDSSEPCILWPQVWIPNTYFSGSKIEQFFNWLFTCVKITSSWKVTCYYHNHEKGYR